MSTTAELIKALGIPRQRISEYGKRGMPREVGAAKTWLSKNVESRKRDTKRAGDLKPLRRARAHSPQDDLWGARLDRARANEREADRLLQKAIQGGKVGQIQPLLKAHTDAIKAVANAEELARLAEIQSGDMVHRESVKVMMEQLLRPLREALDKLPLNERTNCNPDHPEIAEKALTEWRDRLLLRAKSVEGKF